MTRSLVAIACFLATSTAYAEERTTVFPFTATGMPANLTGAPAAMTRALAVAIGGEVANVPIDDVTGLLSCNVELTDCLEQIAGSVSAKRIVFGTIAARGDRFEVDLIRFSIGPEREQRKIVLTSRTERALATELVDKAGRMFGITPAVEPSDEPDDGEPEDTPVPPRDDGPEPLLQPPHSGVTLGTYALITSGVVCLGLGTAFLATAYSVQNDVEAAPTDTLEQLQALAALEDAGRTRMYIGVGLASAGGILAVVGIARAVIQKNDPQAQYSSLVQPWISGRGLGIALTWSVP